MTKKALITGITGQDGAYLAEFLIEKGYVDDVAAAPLLNALPIAHHIDCLKKDQAVVSVDPRYFRPTEVESLLGDASKARDRLGWTPEIPFDQMISEMVGCDLEEAAREAICRRNGFPVPSSCEALM